MASEKNYTDTDFLAFMTYLRQANVIYHPLILGKIFVTACVIFQKHCNCNYPNTDTFHAVSIIKEFFISWDPPSSQCR